MLSEAQVVEVRQALERLYIGRCTVMVQEKIKQSDGSTGFAERVILEDIPCRAAYKSSRRSWGYKSSPQSQARETASELRQVVTLILPPEYEIRPGSKITVTQEGRTAAYKNSGQPIVYRTHQEVVLDLADRWS